MLRNSYKYLSAIALMGVFTIAACGDDDDTTTTTTSSSSSSGSGTGGSTGDPTCTEVCTIVYQCGAANNGALCPAFVPGGVDQMTFVEGPNGNDGCVATCDGNPLLKSLVNEDDCDTTVENLKNASMDFRASCEGGGAGGGGTGGAGGAGGAGGS